VSDPIVRKTLIMTGALVGAMVAFVGTLTAISLLVASHAVGPSADAGAAATAPTTPATKPADGKLPRGTKPPTAT
jgi:hypothetical protein